jgi:hypothetical protein
MPGKAVLLAWWPLPASVLPSTGCGLCCMPASSGRVMANMSRRTQVGQEFGCLQEALSALSFQQVQVAQ